MPQLLLNVITFARLTPHYEAYMLGFDKQEVMSPCCHIGPNLKKHSLGSTEKRLKRRLQEERGTIALARA